MLPGLLLCYNPLMARPSLIIVHGLPGTGKTTIATELSKRLRLPVFAKDALKERMFDALGYSDKTWSRNVSHASHRIMDLIIEQELGTGRSLIIEGNFKPDIDSKRFQQLLEKNHAKCIQILCWADGEALYERFQERESSPGRHPAHVLPEVPRDLVKALLAPGKAHPLDVADQTIQIDTTDFSNVDFTKLAETVAQLTDIQLAVVN